MLDRSLEMIDGSSSRIPGEFDKDTIAGMTEELLQESFDKAKLPECDTLDKAKKQLTRWRGLFSQVKEKPLPDSGAKLLMRINACHAKIELLARQGSKDSTGRVSLCQVMQHTRSNSPHGCVLKQH